MPSLYSLLLAAWSVVLLALPSHYYYCQLAPMRLLARMLEASVALSLNSLLLAARSVALLALPSYYCQLEFSRRP